MSKKIVFFDSGIGGLSTLATCLKLCPTASFEFVADTLNAPYGKLSRNKIKKITIKTLEPYLNNDNVEAIVIACNTATNCAIETLRTHTKIPIIGTEPAIVPATKFTSGNILVFATPTTVMQPKFEALTAPFINRLIILPQPNLASMIERYSESVNETILKEIEEHLKSIKNNVGAFSAVVLGCTHYCLIKPLFEKIFKVKVFDGNLGVANELFRKIDINKIKNGGKIFPQFITTTPTKTNYPKILSYALTLKN